MITKKLQQIWEESPIRSDKGDIHSYLPVYEKLFAPYRTRAKNILEIGLFNGASLLMWEKYFTGKVYGVDCSDQPHDGMADLRPLIEDGTHNITILNAEDAEAIKVFDGLLFDVIIEDASHSIEQQLLLYTIFKNYLAPGGIYVIEDIQDIDTKRHLFWPYGDVIDLRGVKKRYDDVLVIYKNEMV